MIIHIEELLHLDAPVDSSSTPDDMIATAETFYEVKALCERFGVSHILNMREDKTLFSVIPQKITLDEFDMNDLFYNVLNLYFDIEVRYMSLGGKGCDMALAVTNQRESRV